MEKILSVKFDLNLLQAIRHSVEIWKVDIISMPSGFKEDNEKMRIEIIKAHGANTLIFAAASNYGNADYITFPARMYGIVICMFSSTGLVKQSGDFNPAPSEKSKLNFCVLGEEVEKISKSNVMPSKQGHHSGTSIATVIAAEIAALVIDFSRQQDCHPLIANREELKTEAGMSAIFRE